MTPRDVEAGGPRNEEEHDRLWPLDLLMIGLDVVADCSHCELVVKREAKNDGRDGDRLCQCC